MKKYYVGCTFIVTFEWGNLKSTCLQYNGEGYDNEAGFFEFINKEREKLSIGQGIKEREIIIKYANVIQPC